MRRSKRAALGMLTLSGALLLQNGCFGAFWQGSWSTGGPTNHRRLNIAIDVAHELILGGRASDSLVSRGGPR